MRATTESNAAFDGDATALLIFQTATILSSKPNHKPRICIMFTNRHISVLSNACTLGLAMLLTLTGNDLSAETFRSDNSTASVQQQGGKHQSRSDVTRFEDGHRIITRDGNNTDITIQREGYSSFPRFDDEQRFRDGNNRFDAPDLDRRLSQPGTFDSVGSSGATPEASDIQKHFLFRMMERLGWHFMSAR